MTEPRPTTTSQTGVGGDPLSLDVNDLYVKYKVVLVLLLHCFNDSANKIKLQ